MINNIVKARYKAGLTQKQVAAAVNKSQTTVAAWESGRSQPDAATIVKLSQLFNVSSDYLLGLSLIDHYENIQLSNELRLNDLSEQDKLKIDSYVQKVVAFCIDEAERKLSPTFQLVLDCLLSQLTHIENIVDIYRKSISSSMFDDLLMKQQFYKNLSEEEQDAVRMIFDIASKTPIDTVFAQRALYEIACCDGAISLLVMRLKEELSKGEKEPDK